MHCLMILLTRLIWASAKILKRKSIKFINSLSNVFVFPLLLSVQIDTVFNLEQTIIISLIIGVVYFVLETAFYIDPE